MQNYPNKVDYYQGSDSHHNIYTYNKKDYNSTTKTEEKIETRLNKIICFVFLIRITVATILITLNLVWLYPIKNYSAKEEPSVEVRYSLVISQQSNFRILDFSQSDCEWKLEQFLENGAYETFNFKMNKINKYSKIFIVIIYIHVGLVGISILVVIFCDVAIIYTTIDGTIILINLIIFIIFSVFNNKGDYDDFKGFSECYFFNRGKFMDIYDYVIKLHTTFKKDFILNIILLPFSCLAGYFVSCSIKTQK